MPLPVVTTFCCGCDLQLGTKIIGCLQAATWFIITGVFIREVVMGWTELAVLDIAVSAFIAISGIVLYIAAELVRTKESVKFYLKHRCLLLGWIILSIFWVIVFIGMTIRYLIEDGNRVYFTISIYENLTACVFEGFGTYAIVVVYSFRQSIGADKTSVAVPPNQNADNNVLNNENDTC